MPPAWISPLLAVSADRVVPERRWKDGLPFKPFERRRHVGLDSEETRDFLARKSSVRKRMRISDKPGGRRHHSVVCCSCPNKVEFAGINRDRSSARRCLKTKQQRKA